jgi:hypothetical protein
MLVIGPQEFDPELLHPKPVADFHWFYDGP